MAWSGGLGPTFQQKAQVYLYAMGCTQAGLLRLDPDLIVRICWWDRSGNEPMPHVWQENFDPTFLIQIVDWLETVRYAVTNGEDAERTPSVDWCRKCCRFYSVCRLPDLPEVEDFITDEPSMDAARVYLEGTQLAKEAKSMTESAKAMLDGISGTTADGVRVRWISVPGGGGKQAYRRLDVRKVV